MHYRGLLAPYVSYRIGTLRSMKTLGRLHGLSAGQVGPMFRQIPKQGQLFRPGFNRLVSELEYGTLRRELAYWLLVVQQLARCSDRTPVAAMPLLYLGVGPNS